MVDYQIRKVCVQGDPGWVSGIVWDVVKRGLVGMEFIQDQGLIIQF